jgi:hypothetical protein
MIERAGNIILPCFSTGETSIYVLSPSPSSDDERKEGGRE